MEINDALLQYLDQLTPMNHELLEEMERVALEQHVPIIDRPSAQLIGTILRYKGNVQRVLEIGTAIGYSTLWLAEAAPFASIDTIERDEQRYQQAQMYLRRAGVIDRVHLHFADATSYMEELAARLGEERYDLLFIDAAKGQYQRLFEAYTPMLRDGGLVVTDNVFFHGEVVKQHVENKRLRPLVKKIKAYNHWLTNHSGFITSFVPIGDGLALSVKREAHMAQGTDV